jgi:CheY-like chemotaxis protein
MNQPHTILLIEDNEDDVFLMRRALKTAGIRNPVQIMEDGQQGIDYLAGAGPYADRSRFPYPEVVFLDLQLPYKSGFDVLEWLMNSPLSKPVVIVLSSSNSPHDMARCTELGAAHYAIKPPSLSLFDHISHRLGIDWEVADTFVR